MSTHTAAPQPHAETVRVTAVELPHSLVRRDDGIFADPDATGPALAAALDALFQAGNLLVGVDYPALLQALYGHRAPADGARLWLAQDIGPFDPARRALYRAVKIADGQAEYYFEPVWLPDPDDAEGQATPTHLDIDEFIADMWTKGIRCGIDVAAVRAAIAQPKGERVTVARRIDAVPGRPAVVEEVSEDLHRSNAPRQLADGRLDLNSFQNRFPQVHEGVRLLRKEPATRGAAGLELSGIRIPPEDGADLDLGAYAGPGTAVERNRDGEFLVARQTGFLSVEAATSRLAVGDKIVSRDGVSTRTTGNLDLTGDYEEFGDVQEKGSIEGEGITVHGNVYGALASRGGLVLLNQNLIGGSASNAAGDIRVCGMASNAILQAADGTVYLERAENCIVSGTQVRIAHAVNCEIIGDDVEVAVAEGCAIAGRRVRIEAAVPRKQVEMLVGVLQPEGPQAAEVIAAIGARLARFGEVAAHQKAEIERLGSQPDLRRFLLLRAKVQKNEIQFTPEQARQYARLAQDIAADLKGLAEASNALKATRAECQAGEALLAKLEAQRHDASAAASVEVLSVQGELQVRIVPFSPAAGTPYRLAPRDVKARLRGPQMGELLFSGAAGEFAWSSLPVAEPVPT
jgi:predicted thioesterase